jgi:hypothetical protein
MDASFVGSKRRPVVSTILLVWIVFFVTIVLCFVNDIGW